MKILQPPHPLLALRVFVSKWPKPLGEMPADAAITALLHADAPSPFGPIDDELRGTIRDLLRHGGYKPTGRGKPSSEYLVRAAQEGALSSINLAVDAGNAVSLHSGLPISVVDVAQLTEPLCARVADADSSYVFNAGGQSIDVSGLLCLHDANGPCANAVKDAQRTKTSAKTRETLTLIWGAEKAHDRVEQALQVYLELLRHADVDTRVLPVEQMAST